MYFKSLLGITLALLLFGFILPNLFSAKDSVLCGLGVFIVLGIFGGMAIWLDKKEKEKKC